MPMPIKFRSNRLTFVGMASDNKRKIWAPEQFLRASAMLKHVIDIGWTSVRLSVCHTLAPYQNG